MTLEEFCREWDMQVRGYRWKIRKCSHLARELYETNQSVVADRFRDMSAYYRKELKDFYL